MRGTCQTNHTAGLRSQLKSDLKVIRSAYRVAQREREGGELSPRTEWLTDHFHRLEREGRAALCELENVPPLPEHSGKIRIFSLCLGLCAEGRLPNQETLCRTLAAEHLSVWEVQLLPLMLRAALIHRARESVDDPTGTVENTARSLLALDEIDFESVTQEICETQRILMLDPAGIYPRMDPDTQAHYREDVARLAVRRGVGETRVAAELLRQAREAPEGQNHIGFFLREGAARERKRLRVRGILSLVLPPLLALGTAILSAALSGRWYLGVLLFPLLWEIFLHPVQALFTRGVRPRPLPRMALDGAVPEYARTLIVVSDLLPEAARAPAAAAHLEELYRANRQGAVEILMLADYKSAAEPVCPADEANYSAMRQEIDRLNDRYSGGFLLAVRDRTFSAAQGCYTGYERKRGAITQLVQAICGEEVPGLHLSGCTGHLTQVKYLILLDVDTDLPFNTALEMVRCAVHPLNRPQIDPRTRAVQNGYGILVPEVATSIESARVTGFTRVMAGAGGVSSYDVGSSNFYQDLFGQSIFSGKGIVDVHAFHTVMQDRIEEGTVLSHDVLEGGFLCAGFLSGIYVTDAFPTREESYLKRMHRWVRGDWQNVVFLRRHPYGAGSDNPAGALTKYQLFDNLRRSFTSAWIWIALLAAPFIGGAAGAMLAVLALVTSAAGELFGCVSALLCGGLRAFSGRFYSRVLPDAAADLARAGVKMISAARTGFICLDAIVRALWRTAVSRKKMLEWTTAADSEKSDSPKLRPLLPSLLTGFYLALSLEWPLILIGVTQWGDVWFDRWSAKAQPDERLGDPVLREYVTSCAAAQWRYYTEYVTAAENYLPPDNVQETPAARVAHRTSPTNIGLMMLCTLAARDFGFIGSGELFTRLNNTLSTVERLEKYRGHLLNWYDTRTLRPMKPVYVSSVDSGNFLGCITALRAGLAEYAAEEPRLTQLAERLGRLAAGTDLYFLYHEKKNLFHIGYDVEKQELTPSCYDLLMSEARLTSYYAVARRTVPKKHWAALGRTLARDGAYAGPVSWTGTMFEYYMPHLLLPAYENTLLSEALKFCLHCHQERVRGRGIPWGISESGFYAFDPALNYQYEAHGVQKLGLKQGLDDDLVISPYSTFLTLPFAPKEAYRNLKEIEDLEMTGRCGFYEAADFTPGRVQGQDYAVVRSYMAHHVGMSMLACVNTVRGNIMQKRFMADGDMAAAKSILEEKAQQGAVIFDDVLRDQPPKRPEQPDSGAVDVYRIDRARPQTALLSNGEWNTVVTDSGLSRSLYRGAEMTFSDGDLLRRPCGIFCVLRAQGVRFPINKGLAAADEEAEYEACFTADRAVLSAEKSAVRARMEVLVHPRIPGEIRRISIRNRRGAPLKGSLVLYLEPGLAAAADGRAHPAFSRLFVTVEYDASLHALVYTRRPRGEEPPLSMAVGLADGGPLSFETDRTALLHRPAGIFSLTGEEPAFGNTLGVKDVCAAIRIPFEAAPRGSFHTALVITAAQTPQEAKLRLLRARADALGTAGAPVPFARDSLDGVLLSQMLPHLLYTAQGGPEYDRAAAQLTAGQSALWSTGISGDLPIVLMSPDPEDDRLSACLRLCKRLALCGLPFDLAVIGAEDRFDRTVDFVRDCARRCGCAELLGARGGIHLLCRERTDPQALQCLTAAARYIVPQGAERMLLPLPEFVPLQISPVRPCEMAAEESPVVRVAGGAFRGGDFTVTERPQIPWTHVLANEAFGTLVSDAALGYTWAVNSRENKLTPWLNDPCCDNRGELLLLSTGGTVYDLLDGARCTFSPDGVCWNAEAGPFSTRVSVTVPARGSVKYIDLHIHSRSDREETFTCAYYTEPVLGVTRENARFIRARTMGDGLLMENPYGCAVPGFLWQGIEGGIGFYCCDRVRFLSGGWDDPRLLPLTDPCAAVCRQVQIPAGGTAELHFFLAFAQRAEALPDLVRESRDQHREPLPLCVETPDPFLNQMINGWLPHQIHACRIDARTGFYQCGGAWGLRDQLQDAGSLVLLDSAPLRRQLLRACARQFPQGDGLHWWHELPADGGSVRGVRTRYSDDYVWIAYETARYCRCTGDLDFLKESVPYLEGEELREEEKERYFSPAQSAEEGSVYEHAVRALERALTLIGPHGLPLIGGGDWNDGYNRIGEKGQGESVWLAQFLALTLDDFAPLCTHMGEEWRSRRFREQADILRANVEANCFDGDRYIRALFDSGEALGARGRGACAIDSLTQSFAVLCGQRAQERLSLALDTAVRELSDPQNHLIRLFTPPFDGDEGAPNPGYVAAYPPGVRENGGQYTHAAVWLCMALLRAGRTDEGYSLLCQINPAAICADPEAARRYRAEPYALAGDVTANPRAPGQAGWTQYTGSAGWFYVTAVEELLGLHLEDGVLCVHPRLPSGWDGYTAHYRFGKNTRVHLTVRRGDRSENDPIRIPPDGGEHRIVITIC